MMKNGELLEYVHKAAEMGRYGILSVKDRAGAGHLRSALEQQLTEYEKLSASAADMLRAQGKRPKGVGGIAKVSSRLSAGMQTMMDPSPEKVAEMMVQGNTIGMTKSLRHLHDYHGGEDGARRLADRLLRTEEANIEQMKKFL